MNRPRRSVTLQQASLDSPVLAKLTDLTRDSVARLRATEHLLPPALRPAIQAGPIDGTSWCLIVSNNAAASKVRQLLPALLSCLQSRGWEITSIRLKVQITST